MLTLGLAAVGLSAAIGAGYIPRHAEIGSAECAPDDSAERHVSGPQQEPESHVSGPQQEPESHVSGPQQEVDYELLGLALGVSHSFIWPFFTGSVNQFVSQFNPSIRSINSPLGRLSSSRSVH